MKTRKITLRGGFHNANDIRIVLPADVVSKLEKGEIHLILDDVLSDYQRRRLDRHFCGIKDCKCGGVVRAEIDFDNDRKIYKQ